MGELQFRPKKRILRLTLHPETKGLFGEVAQARLNSLASSMEATVDVI